MHQPVLLHEVIKFLEPTAKKFIIDGTIDGGGHATEIIKKISPGGKFLGIDLDNEILKKCKTRIGERKNVILIHGNYADLPEILKTKKLGKADGLLLDLGFSSEQLSDSKRGFSFERDEPLIMTYDDSRKPVKEILKELGENDLAKIIFNFSGEKFAKRIARAIKEQEKIKPIETTRELKDVIEKVAPNAYERGRIHPATRTFQALRIYANDELGNLEKVLSNLPKILRHGGRVVILSYHSLEDRLVKNYFKEMEREKQLKILTKKPITPTFREVENNPRSRSAKLRAAILI